MRAKEFGSWESRDKSKGGFTSYGDGFNRELKGQLYPKYKEFAETGAEEYPKYPEYKDLVAEEENKKEKQSDDGSAKKKDDLKSKNSKIKNVSKATRNLVGRFAAITVGTVVLANANPVLAERFPFVKQVASVFHIGESEETVPASLVSSENWKWSEDKTSATLELLDKDGKVIAEIPATVKTETVDATCTAEGSVTYSASAEKDGKDYSDEKKETLDPLGHYWDEGTATVEDGKIVFVSRCIRCNEEIKGSFNIEEE